MSYRAALLGGAITALATTSAFAQQTQTFSYDVHGRMMNVSRTTGSTSQVTIYALDKAHNRTTRTVGTASSMSVSEGLSSSVESSDSYEQKFMISTNKDKDALPESVVASYADAQGGDML